MDSYIDTFLDTSARIAAGLDRAAIAALLEKLLAIRDRRGRLFVLGVGGSAANASHAVCDLRKLAGIEAYAPTDNVAELTARVNDEGWNTVFVEWLKQSRVGANDGILVFSVGGGDAVRNISPNLVFALDHARKVGATILGVVGRDGGHTARVADVCVIIPPLVPEAVTPHTEAFQAVVWHLLVSHPRLKEAPMKWESQSSK